MQSTFLIFGGHDYEGENLLGGRQTAEEAVEAAQVLARNWVVGYPYAYGCDYLRVVEVPMGNWGANVDGEREGRAIWYWHRPYINRRNTINLQPPLEIDLYPGSQAGAKAARYTRTRGPLSYIVAEPAEENRTFISIPDSMWIGSWVSH